VWLLRGIGAAQTPRLMGGGADRARGYLERSLALFAADAARAPAPRWGRGEVHAWLGVVHARSGRLQEARRAYEASLRVEPEAARVRNVLVPRLARAEARARADTQR
jgi:predicted TPR repeat methyltransferase